MIFKLKTVVVHQTVIFNPLALSQLHTLYIRKLYRATVGGSKRAPANITFVCPISGFPAAAGIDYSHCHDLPRILNLKKNSSGTSQEKNTQHSVGRESGK